MDDLFSEEQQILDNAVAYSEELKKGAPLDPEKYHELVEGYRSLLRQFLRTTKVSDRTTNILNIQKTNLKDKVHYDALTGIYNRRFIEEKLKYILSVMSRSGGFLSVMMLDIDFFKEYNDTYGHSEGDDCLRAIAETISGCFSRVEDFVARYGGEEFTVVLPYTDASGARAMANKILGAIRALNIPHKKNRVASCVTISIGVTTGAVRHTQKGIDYIRCADAALYISKKSGRNRYMFRDFMDFMEDEQCY